MPEYTVKDGKLLDLALSHGLIFPEEFRDRVRDAILGGLRNVNYKSVPGIGAIRGKKLLQINGTVGSWNAVTAGWEHCSQSDIGVHTDVIASGIADGKYLILWAIQVSCGASPGGRAGLSINGDTPIDGESLHSINSTVTFSRCHVRTLVNSDNNTIEVMAKNDVAAAMTLDLPSITLIKIADQ